MKIKLTAGILMFAFCCTLPSFAGMTCTGIALNQVQNCSFETNNLGNNSSGYGMLGVAASPWSFSPFSGISASNGQWGNGVTDGSYDAFLQTANFLQTTNSITSISQILTLSANTVYQLTFDAAQRSGYAGDPFSVSFNGVTVGTVAASSLTSAPATYTFSFDTTSTGASGALAFTATGAFGGDLDTTLDNVSVVSPEPASFLLIAPALGLVALRSFRKRSVLRP